MTPEAKQAAYAAKRAARTGYKPPAGVVTREVRHINGETLEQPLTITYHASTEADVLAKLHAAGLRFVEDRIEPLQGDAAKDATREGSFW